MTLPTGVHRLTLLDDEGRPAEGVSGAVVEGSAPVAFDVAPGVALEGAFEPTWSRSDPTGDTRSFVFASGGPTEVGFVASAELGFAPTIVALDIAPRSRSTVVVPRVDPVTLSGTVRTQRGGALVAVALELRDRSGFVVAALTDADGDYELSLPPGDYDLALSNGGNYWMPDYDVATTGEPIVVPADGTFDAVVPTGVHRVTPLDHTGAVVAGADATLTPDRAIPSSGLDYVATSGTVTFAPGETRRQRARSTGRLGPTPRFELTAARCRSTWA